MRTAPRRTVILVAVAAVLLLILGATLSNRNDDSPSKDSSGESVKGPQGNESDLGIVRRDTNDVTSLGDSKAPLVMVVYSDYRCPFCGVFARDTMPVLVNDYVKPGKLRIEWRDYPLFGEQSLQGAMAARAAGEQGRYWPFHNALYADAPTRGHLEITDSKLMAWAKKAKVPDLEKFKADLNSPRLRKAIQADTEEARTVGATATPTAFIGEKPIVGALPLPAFKQEIDGQLKALEQS